jgi:hypothetical protein
VRKRKSKREFAGKINLQLKRGTHESHSSTCLSAIVQGNRIIAYAHSEPNLVFCVVAEMRDRLD